MNEPGLLRPVNARWDPQIRHDMALRKIEKAIDLALDHPQVSFTENDLEAVAEMMGLRAHAVEMPQKSIDPAKRYRLRSTGEIVTGAELLRRRGCGDESPK